MISLQPSHLTQSPSGIRSCFRSTACLGFLIFLNQAIAISGELPEDGVTSRILANARPPGQNLREIRQVLSPSGLPARGIYGLMAPGREALRTLAAPGLTLENRYYAPGAERAGKVRTLFGRIARRYDL